MKMKNALLGIGVACLLVVANAQAQNLSVNATGTKIVKLNDKVGQNQFAWNSDAPLEKIKGTAEGVTGTFTIDLNNLSKITGKISAKVNTMKTGNSIRDGHLQGGDWLNSAQYPEITFTIASVSNIKTDGNKMTATATGTFTMHGVSKQISIPFQLTYMDESAKTRKRAAGDLIMISANFSISLKDFNVAGTKGTVGSKVGEVIEVTAKLFGSTQ